MKIKKITPIEPKLARCIEVDSPERLFAVGGLSGDAIVSHNSVSQRNIILGCVLRPDSWRFLGIDLKKVELSSWRAYSNVVLGVATTIDDALTVLRFAQQTMMKRYAELEQLGLNNFLDLPEKGQALLVMVDEAGELLSPAGVKALAANTFIPTPEGGKLLKDLMVGDQVLDLYGDPTEVTQKYVPEAQEHYELSISKDSTGESETIVAGAEHYWVAYWEHPDGEVTGPSLVETDYLYEFQANQERLPLEDRVKVKFKRYTSANHFLDLSEKDQA